MTYGAGMISSPQVNRPQDSRVRVALVSQVQ